MGPLGKSLLVLLCGSCGWWVGSAAPGVRKGHPKVGGNGCRHCHAHGPGGGPPAHIVRVRRLSAACLHRHGLWAFRCGPSDLGKRGLCRKCMSSFFPWVALRPEVHCEVHRRGSS